MSDLRSVTASAKALGMSRQRLNVLLDEAQVKRIKKGREALVDFVEAQAAVQQAAASGRVRTPKKEPVSASQESFAFFREQLAAKDAELKEMSEQLKGYEALKERMKVLEGEKERQGAQKSGIFSRLDKAIQTLRGENL